MPKAISYTYLLMHARPGRLIAKYSYADFSAIACHAVANPHNLLIALARYSYLKHINLTPDQIP